MNLWLKSFKHIHTVFICTSFLYVHSLKLIVLLKQYVFLIYDSYEINYVGL